MKLQKGYLIKWVTTHRVYESNGDVLVGIEPVYKYGVVVEVSKKDSDCIAVISCDDGRWHMLDIKYDKFEIVSEGANV